MHVTMRGRELLVYLRRWTLHRQHSRTWTKPLAEAPSPASAVYGSDRNALFRREKHPDRASKMFLCSLSR